jgi:spore coat protein U-like protein
VRRTVVALAFGLFALPGESEAQVTCSYSVSPSMNFGTIQGLPTPQIDIAGNISVTCSSLVNVNHRVCLSLPAGTGGVSIPDRRMVTGGQFVQYQLYTNAARTVVWGALGQPAGPVAVDFPVLIGSRTVDVPVFGRVFAGQAGKSVGTYQSVLTPVARRQNYLLVAPSCQDVTANATNLPPITAQLTIDTSCTVTASPLNFGTVTALTGHAATSNLSVTCTLNGPFSVALDGGAVTGSVNDRRMQLGPGPETIAYQLYRDAARTLVWGNTPGTVVTGTGTGSPQSLPVHGLVPAQAPAVAGTYQDVITVTVTF